MFPPHPYLQTSNSLSSNIVSPFFAPFPLSYVFGCFSKLPAPAPLSKLPGSLKFFQWNAGGLQAITTELIHCISLHSGDLFCIQKFNINSFSSFRILEYCALQSESTYSLSGVLSLDDQRWCHHFRQAGSIFPEPSTFSLSLLDPYCDHAVVNISLNNSSSLTFFNLMLLLFALLQWKAKPIPFPFRSSLFPKFFYSGGISIAITFLGLKRYFRLTWRGIIQMGPFF